MTDIDFKLVPNPEMGPSDMTPLESFTTGDTTETICPHFDTEDESILTGVWECAPCREEIESYPVHEMMTVISGSLTLTHVDGRTEILTTGDTFFIAKGSKCIWEITETFRKYYMIAV